MDSLQQFDSTHARITGLGVQWINSDAEFAALETGWNELLLSARAHPIALSHLWLSTWWRVFKAGRDLCVLIVRNAEGRLLAIAPLARRPVLHRGLVPYRRLELLGTGEAEADEIDSDYLDLIVRVGHEPVVIERLMDYLAHEAPFSWDELIMRPLPADSLTLPLCAKLAERYGLGQAELIRNAGVVLPLPATWEEYLGGLGHKRRYNILRQRKRLDAAGKVEFQWSRTRAEFEAAWPTLVDLHQRRWTAQGRPGCFASPLFERFHDDVGPHLAETGRARIATLALDGRVLAARYSFTGDRTVYAYQSGWDPGQDRKLGVGKLLIGYVIEAAIAEGFRCYDFLKGDSPHKRAWSSEQRQQVALRLWRRGWREPLRAGLNWMADQTRSLRGPRQPTATSPGHEEGD